ncbi:hypothetical protein CI109_102466 [Kwoniella shandongensis]|uniref:Uncharacterized protein n=1 Tax=Kwoniella shandongensis TaxID=1734106 RepID=A0A5M6BZM2_9TREE|nr:uncharacterized protein CI109_003215 [Kwoniella shandongensis]KAA5528317.1 hypothetical protein CI109_003215 [Kwoniella shandongensis]
MSFRLSQLDANDIPLDPPPSSNPSEQPRRQRRYYGDQKRRQSTFTTSKVQLPGNGNDSTTRDKGRGLVAKKVEVKSTAATSVGTKSSTKQPLTKTSTSFVSDPDVINKKTAPTKKAPSKRASSSLASNSRSSSKRPLTKKKKKAEEALPYLTAPEEGFYNEFGIWVEKPAPPAPQPEQSKANKVDGTEGDTDYRAPKNSVTTPAQPTGALSTSSPPATVLVTPALKPDQGQQQSRTRNVTKSGTMPIGTSITPRQPLLYSDQRTLVGSTRSLPDPGEVKVPPGGRKREPLFLRVSDDSDNSSEEEESDEETSVSPVRRPSTRRSRSRLPDHSPYVFDSQQGNDQAPQPSRVIATQDEAGNPTPPCRGTSLIAATFKNPLTSSTWRDPFPHIPAANPRSAAPLSYRLREGVVGKSVRAGDILVEDSDAEDATRVHHRTLSERGSPVSKSSQSRHSKRKKNKTYGKGRSHVYKSGLPDPLDTHQHFEFSQQSSRRSYRGAKRKGSTSMWLDSPSLPLGEMDSNQDVPLRKRSRNGPFPGAAVPGLFDPDSPPPRRKRNRDSQHIPLTKVFDLPHLPLHAASEDGHDPDRERRRRKKKRREFERRALREKSEEARLEMNPNPSAAVRLDNYIERVQLKHPKRRSRKVRKALRPVPGYVSKPISCIPYEEHVKQYQENSRSSNHPTGKQLSGQRYNDLIAATRKSRFEDSVRKQRRFTKEMTPLLPLRGLTPSQDDPQTSDPIVYEPSARPKRTKRARIDGPLSKRQIPRLPFTKDEPRARKISQETNIKQSVQSDSVERRSPTVVLGHSFGDDRFSRGSRTRGQMPPAFVAQYQPAQDQQYDENIESDIDDMLIEDDDIDPHIGQFPTQDLANDVPRDEPPGLNVPSRANEVPTMPPLQVTDAEPPSSEVQDEHPKIDPNEVILALNELLAEQQSDQAPAQAQAQAQSHLEGDVHHLSQTSTSRRPPRAPRLATISQAVSPVPQTQHVTPPSPDFLLPEVDPLFNNIGEGEESFDINALVEQIAPTQLKDLNRLLSQQEAEIEDRLSSRRSGTIDKQGAATSGNKGAPSMDQVSNHPTPQEMIKSTPFGEKDGEAAPKLPMAPPREEARETPANASSVDRPPFDPTLHQSNRLTGIEVTQHLMTCFTPQLTVKASTRPLSDITPSTSRREPSSLSLRKRREAERVKRVHEKRAKEKQTTLPFMKVRQSCSKTSDLRKSSSVLVTSDDTVSRKEQGARKDEGQRAYVRQSHDQCRPSHIGSSRSTAQIPTNPQDHRRVSANTSAPSRISMGRTTSGVGISSMRQPSFAHLQDRCGRQSVAALTTPYKNPTQTRSSYQGQEFHCQSQARPLTPTQMTNHALSTTQRYSSRVDKDDDEDDGVDDDDDHDDNDNDDEEGNDEEDEFASPPASAYVNPSSRRDQSRHNTATTSAQQQVKTQNVVPARSNTLVHRRLSVQQSDGCEVAAQASEADCSQRQGGNPFEDYHPPSSLVSLAQSKSSVAVSVKGKGIGRGNESRQFGSEL